MDLIKVSQITVNLAGREIFRDLSWAIGDRCRIGLIGPNGSGKTTLLKAIIGEIALDAGAIIRMPDVSVGYLPQQIQFPSGKSLLDIAQELPPKLDDVETQLSAIEMKLEDPAVYGDFERLAKVLTQQEEVLTSYEKLEIARHKSRVFTLLELFGFSPDDHNLLAESLSGGQKKLIALVKLVLENPDVLLLDEPDNHLDLDGKHNLESFLREYNGAVVIVSHDRYLLDDVVTQVIELENGRLAQYSGNYSAYKTEKEIRLLRQQQLYSAQQKEIARIEAAIKRFEHWARLVVDERHIRQARHRRKMLDRMEEKGDMINRVTQQRVIDIQLEGWRGSNKALEVKDLAMSFEGKMLFENLNFVLWHKDRVGLVGPNGAGKSLLFKLILGEFQPTSGDTIIGPSSSIGYYAQEQQTLDRWRDRTPLDLLRNTMPLSENAAVAQLIKFAFDYSQVRQPISILSGGEQSRLQILMLMLQQPNILLLDEPTNNLDIVSIEALEEALDEFVGALLIISHDRYFLDQIVNKVIELKEGQVTHYEGGYTDYAIR